MSGVDDERIARLTELARRVWPDERGVQIGNAKGKGPARGGIFAASKAFTLIGIGAHPRAIDALEAALLALLGEDEELADELARCAARLRLRARARGGEP